MNDTLVSLFFRNRKAFRPLEPRGAADDHTGVLVALFFGLMLVVANNLSLILRGGFDLDPVGALLWSLQGHGAAALMVLGGLCFGRAYAKSATARLRETTALAGLLMATGLIASWFFAADMLRYSAIILLLGAPFARARDGVRWAAILMVCAVYLILQQLLDVDSRWLWAVPVDSVAAHLANWMRDLLFTGWYPVLPWLAFFLVGLSLAGLDLKRRQTAWRLIGLGLCGLLLGLLFSVGLSGPEPVGPGLTVPTGGQPSPVSLWFLLSGTAGACLLLGGSLVAVQWRRNKGGFVMLARAGGHSLTLYLAHILIARTAMWVYEAVHDGGPPFIPSVSVMLVALMFGLAAVIYADIWARYFKRGPLEALMR